MNIGGLLRALGSKVPSGSRLSILPLTQHVTSLRHVSTEHKQKQRFNVGVVGMGRIGRMHTNNLLQNRKFAIQWVMEESEALWDSAKDSMMLHDTPFYTSEQFDDLLSDQSLDAVLIFSSTPSHTPLSCKALEKGKAVFTEKPAGETIEDIRKCFQTSKKYDRPFLIGFNRRFDPTMSEAFNKVKSGSVGKLQYLRFTTRDSPKPSYDFLKTCDTTGCNILADLCVHDVDQLVWLTQSERPEHVYVTTHAHDSVMAEFGEADAIGMIIKYKSGAIASFDGFRESVYGYDIRMEIFGSDGMVMANNPRETATYWDKTDGGHENRLYLSFPQRFDVSFQAELDHFADCLAGKTKPLITEEESLLVAEIIDKGLESFKLKKPVFF